MKNREPRRKRCRLYRTKKALQRLRRHPRPTHQSQVLARLKWIDNPGAHKYLRTHTVLLEIGWAKNFFREDTFERYIDASPHQWDPEFWEDADQDACEKTSKPVEAKRRLEGQDIAGGFGAESAGPKTQNQGNNGQCSVYDQVTLT